MNVSDERTRWPAAWLRIFSLILMCILLVLDVRLPRGTTPAFGYTAVIFLMLRSRNPNSIIKISILCSLLTWLALFLEPGRAPLWMAIVDRILVTVVLWLVTVLGLRRRQAEERLAHTISELARSNTELERFASVVAHDLRSPMMTLSGCAQLLEHELSGNSNAAVQESLEYVRGSVNRMSRLIESLLNYARVGAGELELSDCDTGELLASVLSNLNTVLRNTEATVTHDTMPTVRGNAVLLTQLFQNLIENAIKYRGDSPPRVHVASSSTATEWVLSVRDNGLGIDPRHSEQVFEIFKRLHADESRFSGLGMGLATCKKIVERHHGRIWLESQPGQGTTFYVSIPRPIARPATSSSGTENNRKAGQIGVTAGRRVKQKQAI